LGIFIHVAGEFQVSLLDVHEHDILALPIKRRLAHMKLIDDATESPEVSKPPS
jgi:hypothetical protein